MNSNWIASLPNLTPHTSYTFSISSARDNAYIGPWSGTVDDATSAARRYDVTITIRTLSGTIVAEVTKQGMRLRSGAWLPADA